MSTKKKILVWGYTVLLILSVAAGFLAGHDNQDKPASEGWRPTFLLRFFNSDKLCKQTQYSHGTFACGAALNRESSLTLILISTLIIITITWFVYMISRWFKKRRR